MIFDEDGFPESYRRRDLAADVRVTMQILSEEQWRVPRYVITADRIGISCGLTNFERTSLATRATERFGDSFAELYSMQDYDEFADSFVATDPQL